MRCLSTLVPAWSALIGNVTNRASAMNASCRLSLPMSRDGADFFTRKLSSKIMVTTRSQAAPSHCFVPVNKHRMEGQAMDDPPSSSARQAADSVALNVTAIRDAAIRLENTKISADQILIKLNNSATEYAPTCRACDALQHVTGNFSLCVEKISNALLRFNIPDSRLPQIADDLATWTVEVYSALNAAADSFYAASIAGQDDCGMGFISGKSANRCAAIAFSRIYSFTLTAFDINTVCMNDASMSGNTDTDARLAIASASDYTFRILYDAFDRLIESSH